MATTNRNHVIIEPLSSQLRDIFTRYSIVIEEEENWISSMASRSSKEDIVLQLLIIVGEKGIQKCEPFYISYHCTTI